MLMLALLAICAVIVGVLVVAILNEWFQHRAGGVGHAQMIPQRAYVRPWAFKNASGAYQAAYWIDARDGDSIDGQTLGQDDASLSRAVLAIDPEFVVHFRRRYVAARGYDRPDEYFHPIAQGLDDFRAEAFDGTRSSTFSSRRVMWLAWRPPSEGSQKIRAAATVGRDAVVRSEDDLLVAFEQRLRAIETAFEHHAKIQRISTHKEVEPDSGEEIEYSDLHSELAWATRHVKKKFRLPNAAYVPANSLVAAPTYRGGYDIRIGDREFAIVYVKGLPDLLWPRKLTRLKELGAEFEIVTRWLPAPNDKARQAARDARGEWLLSGNAESAGNSYAVEMVAEASEIIGMVERGFIGFGQAEVFIVISHRSRAVADKTASNAVALLDDLGVDSFRVTKTAESDYITTLPGIARKGLRKFTISTINVTHLMDFHAESQGRRYTDGPNVPARTPAIVQAVTLDRERYRVHLNDDPMDVGMHYGVGAMGVGKSYTIGEVVLGFVSRMPFAGATFFDKGASSLRLTRFLDGAALDLLHPGGEAPGLALYANLADPFDRGQLKNVLAAMVEGGGVALTDHRDSALDTALRRIAECDPAIRSHSLFCELLQDDGAMREPLSKFSRSGDLGRTVDCERDEIDIARVNMVEMRRLLGQPRKLVVPVLMAIYWKMRAHVRQTKERLNRHDLHWLYEQDEAHSILEEPAGAKFIREMYRESRRERMTLGLWSQSMGHFQDSDCWNDIMTACSARFYFRNAALAEEDSAVAARSDRKSLRQYYRDSGLPERGIRQVASLPPYSVLFANRSGELKRIRMEPDEARKAILGRTSPADNERLEDYRRKYPKGWRWELLRAEGVPERQILHLRDLYDAWSASDAEYKDLPAELVS